MLKINLRKSTAAMISLTVYLLVGFALDPLIGIAYLPVAFLVSAALMGIVFGHGLSAGANGLFFLLSLPYVTVKLAQLHGGAAAGLFVGVLVVVLGVLVVCLVPAISPAFSLIVRMGLRKMAASAGTRPLPAGDTVRAALLSVFKYAKDPFRFPVITLPGRQNPLTVVTTRDFTDVWLAPVPVPYHVVAGWPDGKPTEDVMERSGVLDVGVSDRAVVVRFRKPTSPDNFLGQAQIADAVVANVLGVRQNTL